MLPLPSIMPQPKNRLNDPILAPILQNRPLTVIITSSALLHGGLAILGWPSWQCPLRYQLGIPCPGCGLSRAIATLLHGDWKTSLTFHAFAPLFLIALILIASMVILPTPQRQRIIQHVSAIEQKTGITAFLLIALISYWFIRLLFFREAFFELIMG